MTDDVGMPPSLFGKNTPAPVRRNVRPAGQVDETPREALKRKLGGVELPPDMTDAEVSRLLASDAARADWLAARAAAPTVARQTLMLRLDVHELPPELTDSDVTALLAMDGPSRTTWFRAQPFCNPPAEGFATEALRQAWADTHRWCPPPALSTVRGPGGAATTPSSMEIVTLLGPSDGSRVQADSSVTFSWKLARGAAGYEVRVCADAEMTRGCLSGGSVRTSTPDATMLMFSVPAGDYFWNVRAVGADGTFGPASEMRHLSAPGAAAATTPSEPLPAPVLAAPADATVVDPNSVLAFRWAAVPGAASYDVVVCTDREMTLGCLGERGRLPASQLTLDVTIPAGTYYWTVRALSADGTVGHSAGVRRVTAVIVQTGPEALPRRSPESATPHMLDGHAPFETTTQALTAAPVPAKKSIVPWVLGAAAVVGIAWWMWPKSGTGPHSNPSHSFIGSRVTDSLHRGRREGTTLSLEGHGPMMRVTIRWDDGSVGVSNAKDLGMVSMPS